MNPLTHRRVALCNCAACLRRARHEQIAEAVWVSAIVIVVLVAVAVITAGRLP